MYIFHSKTAGPSSALPRNLVSQDVASRSFLPLALDIAVASASENRRERTGTVTPAVGKTEYAGHVHLIAERIHLVTQTLDGVLTDHVLDRLDLCRQVRVGVRIPQRGVIIALHD